MEYSEIVVVFKEYFLFIVCRPVKGFAVQVILLITESV